MRKVEPSAPGPVDTTVGTPTEPCRRCFSSLTPMERIIELPSGIDICVEDQGEGRPVLMIHGFPETKYSWRHQVAALAANGYRAVAMDCRGYGKSSKPTDTAAYSLEAVVEDVVGVIDSLDLRSPVVVGHDWGSLLMWTAAVTHPDRLGAVASLNVPYRGWCVGFPTIDFIKENLMDRFDYVVAFQEEGMMEARFAADPAGWLGAIYRRLAGHDSFLSEEEFGTFVDAFTAGGLRGPLSYYRNIDINNKVFAPYENAPITIPTLMVVADRDPVLPPVLALGMERWIEDLEVVSVEAAGHWVQQEQPEAVNRAMLEFLARLDA